MLTCVPVTMCGVDLWGLVVETDGGPRVRLEQDDWERLRLHPGQQVAVVRAGRKEEWFFVAEVVALPPVVWVVFATRLQRGREPHATRRRSVGAPARDAG